VLHSTQDQISISAASHAGSVDLSTLNTITILIIEEITANQPIHTTHKRSTFLLLAIFRPQITGSTIAIMHKPVNVFEAALTKKRILEIERRFQHWGPKWSF
jgi:hypothetical protein